MANINDFKARLAGGGARANQFRVTMSFPSYSTQGGEVAELAFLCNATSIPAMTVASFNVGFRGRQIKLAGERTYADWSITVLNDTDFLLRNAFERWQSGINFPSETDGYVNPAQYQRDCIVDHLDRNGSVIKSYFIRDAFPTEVSATTLSYTTNDDIETFDVTFAYQFVEANTTGRTTVSGTPFNI